jgi:peptidoglycan hydrolase-like protein with peptidoglycan-binding domain
MNPATISALLALLQTGLTALAAAPAIVPPATVPVVPVHPLGFPSIASAPDPTDTTTSSVGPTDIMKVIQTLLGVPVDGYWGPQTQAAVLALKAKLGV